MKIVHLLGWYFPDSVGGTEVYVEGLCRRLGAAGHEVLVAAPDSHQAAPERYEHDGVRVFRYPIADTPTRDEANQRVPVRGADRLHRWLAEERPDILHVHSFTSGVGLAEIREARRLGMRVIVTCHLPSLAYMCRTGELMQWGRTACDGIAIPDKCAACALTRLGMPQAAAELAGAIPPALGAALGRIPGRIGTTLGMTASIRDLQTRQAELFGMVERFVVLNDTARRMLIANGSPGQKIALNRLGVGPSDVAPKPAAELQPTARPVRFLYLGRLFPQKGVIALVRAAIAVARDVPFHLDVRGPQIDAASRAYSAEVRLLAAADPRLTIAGGVAGDEVSALLKSYDVLLCPSLSFENGPTIALEAMAVGTPVIGSRVGNLIELIDDGVTGRLVDPGNVPAWSDALRRTATDPATTIDRWRRALPPVRTMDDVARDYLTLYAA